MLGHRLQSPGCVLVAVLSLAATLTGPALAQQDSACTWDRCALRVHRNFLGARLVRGIHEEKVAGIAWFPRPLPFLAERSDSAATHYNTFRSRQRNGTAVLLVGLAAVVASSAIVAGGDDGAGLAVGVGGFTLMLAGGALVASGQNHLSRAVWWYNRSFAEDVPPPDER
jgi:hypothetical protein